MALADQLLAPGKLLSAAGSCEGFRCVCVQPVPAAAGALSRD